MEKVVRLLLIGDDGVGKTSLMSSYISNHFPHEVPHVMIEAMLPPQTTASNTCVIIMDSSARPGDREVLKEKMLIADCIIAVYDITKPCSLDNLVDEWLPLVASVNRDEEPKPVLLVGNKADMEDDYIDDSDKVQALLGAFPFVMFHHRCSAAKLAAVESIFYFGEMVVTFPLGPIFDIHSHIFTPACRRAFLRIFRVFDLDGDNLLCDSELSDCNMKCFETPFTADDMTNLKLLVSKTTADGIENNCITFEGFLTIIKSVMIDQHMYEIPWAILHRCGYDDDLQLVVMFKCTIHVIHILIPIFKLIFFVVWLFDTDRSLKIWLKFPCGIAIR
jgi:Ras family protein T1